MLWICALEGFLVVQISAELLRWLGIALALMWYEIAWLFFCRL